MPALEHAIHSITSTKSVAIIGGGISGLCTAYWLQKAGVSVTLFERDDIVGGTMKTIRDKGWLIETGPNSALETTPLFREIVTDVGISDAMVYANPLAAKRYILCGGTLHPLPMSPQAFIASRLWSVRAKLRLLAEPFIGRAKYEESIAEFVERRLGKEFLDYAINPFVAGVYAGSPEQLSVQTAFPKLYALEAKYGGLVRGMIGGRRERKQRKEVAKDRAKLFSFVEGMQTLPRALGEQIGGAVKTGCTVERIVPMRAGSRPIYTISYAQNDIRLSHEANAVVLAVPASAAASIVQPIDPETAQTLRSISYPPVTEVFLGYANDQIGRNLDGFGFLVPEVEQRSILGCIWSSSLFDNRSPEEHSALTVFVGGARQPDLALLPDGELLRMVESELAALMSVRGAPAYTRITRWDAAIPQYTVGYQRNVLQRIERFEQNFQGSFICANYKGGIAVGDCVMSAKAVAERVGQYFLS
jgi:oxygen-dependent protoporphyrinogen oxidase